MNTYLDLIRRVSKNTVERSKDKRVKYGIVHAIDTTTIDVRPGNSTSVIKHVSVIGDINTLTTGEIVTLAWWNSKRPVAIIDMNRDHGFTLDPHAWYDYAYTNFTSVNSELDRLDTAIQNIDLGHIENPGGYIGGWILDADNMYSGSGSDRVQLSTAANGYRIWAGAELWTDAPFSVQKNGTIKAILGQIAGWTLAENELSADNGNAVLNSSEYPYLGLGGADAYGEDGIWLGKDTDDIYKMFIGSITGNRLFWDGENLNISGKMIFSAQEASLVGGWLIVAKGSGSLTSDVGSSDTQIEFGQTMTPGDYVLIRAHTITGFAQSEYILVGAAISGTTYNVTRTSPQPWFRGTIYQVLGQAGDGYIELSASGQRMSVMEQTATPNTPDEVIRIGELTGWQSAGLSGNGLAIGDYANDIYLSYDPTNGLIVKGTINADDGYLGDLDISGTLSVGLSGKISTAGGDIVMDSLGLAFAPDAYIHFGDISRNMANYGTGRISGMHLGVGDAHYTLKMSAYTIPSQLMVGYYATDLVLNDMDDLYGVFHISKSGFSTPYSLLRLTNNGDLFIRGGLAFGELEDTNLYRSAANVLKTDDDLYVTGNLTAASTLNIGTDVNLYRSAADVLKTDDALYVTGNLTAASTLLIGADANLYRDSANVLKTDDSLIVDGNLTVNGTINGGGSSGGGVDRLSFAPRTMGTISGSTTLTTFQTYYPSVGLVDGSSSNVDFVFVLPPGWGGGTATVTYYIGKTSTLSTKYIRMETHLKRMANGALASTVDTAVTYGTHMLANGAYYVNKITHSVDLSGFSDGDGVAMRVTRNGSYGGDDFSDVAQLMAVEISI